ncbi:hypothetical protein DEU56DRAFT_904970 [Suillus clintonianus]|uniref:uncharacterized protein n=1 Tax=Suillus clintonianus TaxID=1904413 RepID=UPI001B88470D|nr:uncharacterized protein DEU56DRAFT_904970 [Suillus clintonianus]KAG2118488.1 hypothetical protein DEU56DRAFT_904970 [Suillus clintonianus]
MLAPSRNHRAEAKFNVATEFPHLGLHSAAVSGDIGLVQFALNHGQPVNSVLDGVLPLHAACAGGNDLVVNLLIKHGADVNASRLPRRYSDRSRDCAAAPIVGPSGATPLHFAAANGHASVVRTLLIHGAHPNRPDKHGITPEVVARQNGWIECADILASEILARARGDNTPDSDGHSSRERSHAPVEHLESSLRKKLHFKRSIDHALTALKVASGAPDIDQQPPFVRSGSSEQDDIQPQDSPSSGRRPSLHDEQPHRPSLPKISRRPRSAGTGAEATPPRKLNSKLSLLSLFKKSNVDASSSSVTSVSELPINSPPSSSSPVPVPGTASPASTAAIISSPRLFPAPLSSSPHETPAHELHRRRLETNPARASPDPNPWHRSTSSSSTPGEEIPEPTAPVRPGILRMHARSSSGQASQQLPTSRIIRFDNSTSSSSSLAARARSPPSRGSVPHDSRLRTLSMGAGASDVDRIPDTIEESPRIPQSPPPILVNAIDLDDLEDEEEEYGVPIFHSASTPNIMLTPDRAVPVSAQFPFSINVPPPDDSIMSSESRLRGDSVSSAGTTGTASTYTQSSSSDAAWPPTPSFSGASPLIASRSMDTDTSIGIDGLPMSPRVRRTPSGLDISSISSRAAVEALVQRAQQSVLDMAVDLEENSKRDKGTGRTPLSLRLAMFGESLAIERMMKEEEEAVEKGLLVVDAGTTPPASGLGVGERSLLSSSRPRAVDMTFSRSSSGSGASSEDASLQHRTRIASDEIRRTASADFRRTMSDSPFDGITRTSDNTRRTRSPPVASRHLPLPLPHQDSQHPHPLPLPSPRTQKSYEAFAYTPPRSRTPDPYDTDPDEDAELPGLGIGLGMGMGIPLSRISTAPTHVGRISTARNDVSTMRRLSPPARNISLTAARNIPTKSSARNASPAARTLSSSGPRDISATPAARSVNKLSRMGFSTLEGWQPAPITACSPPAKQRFGGIRTIVRGFQGK